MRIATSHAHPNGGNSDDETVMPTHKGGHGHDRRQRSQRVKGVEDRILPPTESADTHGEKWGKRRESEAAPAPRDDPPPASMAPHYGWHLPVDTAADGAQEVARLWDLEGDAVAVLLLDQLHHCATVTRRRQELRNQKFRHSLLPTPVSLAKKGAIGPELGRSST